MDNRSSRIQVQEAIKSLYEAEMPVTTDSIQRHTGLKMSIVADCIKELKERDEIWCPERGIYRPKDREEASQPILFTSLPDGGMKLEKGDQLICLTSREWRQQVAPAAAGYCAQTAVIEHTHETMRLVEHMAKLRKRLEALEQQAKQDPRQIPLEV
jgi:hypothetical protein